MLKLCNKTDKNVSFYKHFFIFHKDVHICQNSKVKLKTKGWEETQKKKRKYIFCSCMLKTVYGNTIKAGIRFSLLKSFYHACVRERVL